MHWQRKIKVRVCILLAAVFLSALFLPVKMLVVENEAGTTVFRHRAADGTEFRYRFFHSYDKDWVEETFVIRGNHFNMAKHRFRAFTYDAREHTFPGDFYFEDGYGVVDNIEQYHESRMEKLDIRVARTVVQYLIIQGEERLINDLAQPGSLLKLKIAWQPMIYSLL